MADKWINVNVNFATLPPTYTLSGAVDPNNTQCVDIDPSSDEVVHWLIVASNETAPVYFATPSANGKPAIEFAPGAPWAAGQEPAIVYDYANSVHLDDDNLPHTGTYSHYYTINLVYNGVVYPLDPEVEEQGN